MFGLTALELARIQFGFTVSFHIIFPAITIGLASYLVVLEGMWLWKKDRLSRSLSLLVKIFAVSFRHGRRLRPGHGLSVRHQLELVFGLRRRRDRAASHLRGDDRFLPRGGLSRRHAVRLEKGRPGLHFLATLMVAAGTLISATWILASNSWMQTPQGYGSSAGASCRPTG